MKLVIVESPTKGRTIGQFLGKEYRVEPSFGHVRDLPASTLGIDVEHDFSPKYVIPPKAKKTITILKKESKRAKETVLATDEDREGESIAWHLSQVLELKNPKRIVFHEITKRAIAEALKNPRSIDQNRVNAQQARRLLDRLVGYKLSPFLWQKVARGLSAGRVQSVAVRLIADREQEIQSFVSQEYWSIEVVLTKIQNPKSVPSEHVLQGEKSQNVTAILVKKHGKTVGKLDIKTKEEAHQILKDLKSAEYHVETIENKEIQRNPLPPFTTSTLQQTVWMRLHFPTKFTMSLAQQLYETGLITYHRTDSLNLSDGSKAAAKQYITKEYGKEYWPGYARAFKTKTKGAQEAHEAIRPVFTEPAGFKLTPPQQKMYDLIWKRFIASQMSQATFDSTTVDIAARNYIFHATGQTLRFDGFLKIYPMQFEEAKLPPLEKNEILALKTLVPAQHFTEPPPRYTEATLVKTLEEQGIGRPSTYAPIISTVQERGYVEKNEQRRFCPTKLGIEVNNLLVQHFPEIVNVQFTASMEEKLDDIAKGKKEWSPMLKEFYEPFEANLEKKYHEVQKKKTVAEKTDKICPQCSSFAVIREGRFGKFYACSTFPACRYTENIQETLVSFGQCPKCAQGNVVSKRTKKGKVFYGCSRYPLCDFAAWQKPILAKEAKVE